MHLSAVPQLPDGPGLPGGHGRSRCWPGVVCASGWPGLWPLSQAQGACWLQTLVLCRVAWSLTVPLEIQQRAALCSHRRGSQRSGASLWVWTVTQAAVAFPGCCVHSQVLWSLQEKQMRAGHCCCCWPAQPAPPIRPVRPEHALALVLSDLLCGRSSVLPGRTLPWSAGRLGGASPLPPSGILPQCPPGWVA